MIDSLSKVTNNMNSTKALEYNPSTSLPPASAKNRLLNIPRLNDSPDFNDTSNSKRSLSNYSDRLLSRKRSQSKKDPRVYYEKGKFQTL